MHDICKINELNTTCWGRGVGAATANNNNNNSGGGGYGNNKEDLKT